MIPDPPTSVSDAPIPSLADFEPRPGNGVCERLGDKWTVLVLWNLANADRHRLRSSELRRRIGGVTQRMLTLTLRNLERDGLVRRECFPEVPPRVEYELSDAGLGVLHALSGLNRWVRDNLPRIEESRRSFDGADR